MKKNTPIFLSEKNIDTSIYDTKERQGPPNLINLNNKPTDMWQDLRTTKAERIKLSEQNSTFQENFKDFDYKQISNPMNSSNESNSVVYEKLGLVHGNYDFLRGTPAAFSKKKKHTKSEMFVSRFELNSEFDNEHTSRLGYFSNDSPNYIAIDPDQYI